MSNRDEHIQDKEKKVYDLKKRNQELEKYKFVLDYRIKELKEQVEPRETHISEMTTEIQSIMEKLKELGKQRSTFEEQIGKYENKLVSTREKSVQEHRKSQRIERYVNSFRSNLEEVIFYFQDSEVLKKAASNFYHKFYDSNEPVKEKEELMLQEEYAMQQQTLKDKISVLRFQAEKRQRTYRNTSVSTMNENQELIRQINELRGNSSKINKDPGKATNHVGNKLPKLI